MARAPDRPPSLIHPESSIRCLRGPSRTLQSCILAVLPEVVRAGRLLRASHNHRLPRGPKPCTYKLDLDTSSSISELESGRSLHPRFACNLQLATCCMSVLESSELGLNVRDACPCAHIHITCLRGGSWKIFVLHGRRTGEAWA